MSVDSKNNITKGSTQFCMNLRKLQIMRFLYYTFPQYNSYFYEKAFLFQPGEFLNKKFVICGLVG